MHKYILLFGCSETREGSFATPPTPGAETHFLLFLCRQYGIVNVKQIEQLFFLPVTINCFHVN